MDNRFIRRAILQAKEDDKVRCLTCQRSCVLAPGGLGWCRTRANRAGELVTLIYGVISSLSANPIEKKPFYHFQPGSRALTVGSWSCNFGCPWCQNWHISKAPPPQEGEYLSPEEFLALTIENDCQGTSISFNEPTLSMEWALDVFPLARQAGLYNTFVSNGYMTMEALNLLVEAGLDAINVDVKGNNTAVKEHCQGIDNEKVWQTCREAYQRGVHLEVTTLVIPTVNDDQASLEGIAGGIASELGAQVPWHISGYFPAYRFHAPPTPISTLERAWQIGKSAGLEYVYVGNVPGHRYDHTYCPTCGEILIRRLGLEVLANSLHQGKCPHCRKTIAGVW